MGALSSGWSEGWRVVAISAALAFAFVALERIELSIFDAAGADRVSSLTRSAGDDARLAAEAEAVAARSSARWSSLPPGHRLAAFRIGYEVGWASEFAGSFAMSAADVQARAAPLAAAHVAVAREQAREMGIDPARIDALPTRSIADFTRLEERFDADEAGMARAVEERLTPVHRHLFLLGARVGSGAAMVETSGGERSLPAGAAIRREATLAGVATSAWQPLANDPRGATPALVLESHRAALAGLLAELASDAPGDAARAAATPR